MVVICPNCGREIYSDPDSCVMCGWRRGQPMPNQKRPRRDTDYRRESRQLPPRDSRYPSKRYEERPREPPRMERQYRAPPRREERERPRGRYPSEEERYYQRVRRDEQRMEQAPSDRYRQSERLYPPRRDQRPRHDEERGYPPQPRVRRIDRRPRYDYEEKREPLSDLRPGEYREERRNFCPNCGREIYTDPDNCVLCGWSRESEERRVAQIVAQRRAYPEKRTYGYRQRTYQGIGGPEYRREDIRRESYREPKRYVDEEIRGRQPLKSRESRTWYRPETEDRRPPKKGVKDRIICENCGNPSLQFFADGLGRCPGCGYRFRFSQRPQSVRSKQKHKQFICSSCNGKNLQFFSDGSGLCPQCKREFRWKK